MASKTLDHVVRQLEVDRGDQLVAEVPDAELDAHHLHSSRVRGSGAGCRLTGSDEREEKKVSRWESTALGEPQVMVARFNRVEVEGRDIRVVFFIPRDVPY